MDNIIIIGGGGHSRALIELIKVERRFNIFGILDPALEKGKEVGGIPVLGGDVLLDELFHAQGIKNICVGVGSVKDNSKRRVIYQKVKSFNFSVPFLIHPTSIILGDSKILEGVQIMAGSIIQTGSFLGENTIVNTGTIIEHDCKIGKHVHICPGAVVSGGCIIGDNSFIGAGTTILNNINIGVNSIIGAGSVVTRDVPDDSRVVGAPAK
jgi:UDP-perosamine 4-acetyltransferase